MAWEDGFEGSTAIVDTSYDTPRFPETVTRNLVTQGQAVDASSNDQWTGFFQKAIGQVFDYSLRKDAAQTGVQIQQATRAAALPVYGQGTPAGMQPLTSGQVLFFGAVVLAFVFASGAQK